MVSSCWRSEIVKANMGGNRCGVEPGEPAVDLARLIAAAPATAPGTFEFEVASGVYTELRCGSYIFMADYSRNLDRDGAPTKAFEPSLFVWATVMSRSAQDRAIVDAGLKALAFASGLPLRSRRARRQL